MQRLVTIANVLNTIPVSGKQNLANLSGSIAVIEEVVSMLEGADIQAVTPVATDKTE